MRLLNKDKYKEVNLRKDVLELREEILTAFGDIEFIEETHQYFLRERELTSVSHFVHQFQEPFNKVVKAQETFDRNFNNPNSKYFKMTKEEILEQWDKTSLSACERGTYYHSFGEDCFYLVTEQYDKIERKLVDGNLTPKDEEEQCVVDFWNDLPKEYIPILCETRVYNTEMGYAGTFDLLMAYDDGKTPIRFSLIILDYKTNGDLFKNFKGKTLLPPFEIKLDCPMSMYELQLNSYQIPLENIGLKIVGRRVIWVKKGGYELFRLPDLTQIMRNYFAA